MSARSRTCPECGHRWAQRHARYCGWCGSPLAEVVDIRRRRTSTTVAATRALAAVGLGGLLVIILSLDLARFQPAPDPTVDLEPEPSLADNPLSQDEIEQLQARADPERLRCEPRGCEVWRLELGDHYTADGGVVHLDNGLLVLRGGSGAWHEGDGDAVEPGGDPVLVAVDPATGQEAWSFPIALPDGQPTPWVQLTPGPHGVLAMAGTAVISLDPHGEQVWRWDLADVGLDGGEAADRARQHPGEIWGFDVPGDDIVLLNGTSWGELDVAVEQEADAETDEQLASPVHQERRFLTAIEADTGEELWSRSVGQTSMPNEALLVIDTEGDLQRLDPRTGEVLWHGPQVGDAWVSHLQHWAVVHGHDGVQRVFDVATGTELGGFGGALVHGLQPVGDGAIGVVVDDELAADGTWEEDDAADLALVHLDADGTVAWVADLGTQTAWWRCCFLLSDGGDGTVSVGGDHEVRRFDLATGELLEVRSVEGAELAETREAAWEPAPGLLVWWNDGRRIRIATDDGEVTVRSRHYLQLPSLDLVHHPEGVPEVLVIADEDHLLGIRLPGGS